MMWEYILYSAGLVQDTYKTRKRIFNWYHMIASSFSMNRVRIGRKAKSEGFSLTLDFLLPRQPTPGKMVVKDMTIIMRRMMIRK